MKQTKISAAETITLVLVVLLILLSLLRLFVFKA